MARAAALVWKPPAGRARLAASARKIWPAVGFRSFRPRPRPDRPRRTDSLMMSISPAHLVEDFGFRESQEPGFVGQGDTAQRNAPPPGQRDHLRRGAEERRSLLDEEQRRDRPRRTADLQDPRLLPSSSTGRPSSRVTTIIPPPTDRAVASSVRPLFAGDLDGHRVRMVGPFERSDLESRPEALPRGEDQGPGEALVGDRPAEEARGQGQIDALLPVGRGVGAVRDRR